MSAPTTTATTAAVLLKAADLPAHCPLPSQKIWNSHPKVFLNFNDHGESRCPYCGTLYQLDGPIGHGH